MTNGRVGFLSPPSLNTINTFFNNQEIYKKKKYFLFVQINTELNYLFLYI